MKRYSEAERKRFVLRHQRGGLSTAAFCQVHGISAASLGLWRRRYGQRSPTAVPSSQQWVPVVLEAEALRPKPGRGYVLSCSAGSLEVPPGFDAQEVSLLWRVLAPLRSGEALP